MQLYILIGLCVLLCWFIVCCVLCLHRYFRKRKLKDELKRTNRAIRDGKATELLPDVLRPATEQQYVGIASDSPAMSSSDVRQYYPSYDHQQMLSNMQIQ